MRPRNDDVPDAIFTWNILVTSILILIAFPLLTAALFGAGRRPPPGGPCLRPARRSSVVAAPVLVLRPPRGVTSSRCVLRDRLGDLPVFPQTDLRYTTLVYATLSIAALVGRGVAHHMFATGAVLLRSFRS